MRNRKRHPDGTRLPYAGKTQNEVVKNNKFRHAPCFRCYRGVISKSRGAGIYESNRREKFKALLKKRHKMVIGADLTNPYICGIMKGGV